MFVSGCNDSVSQLAVLGEELKVEGRPTKGYALFIIWEWWGWACLMLAAVSHFLWDTYPIQQHF